MPFAKGLTYSQTLNLDAFTSKNGIFYDIISILFLTYQPQAYLIKESIYFFKGLIDAQTLLIT